MKRLIIQWSVLVIVSLLFIACSEEIVIEPLNLPNASFEEPLVNMTPPGWSRNGLTMEDRPEMTVSDKFASDGKYSFRMEGALAYTMDGGERKGRSIMLRSDRLPASPGEVYAASVNVYAEKVSGPNPQIFLEFWDANNKRIDAAMVSQASSGVVGKWERVTVVGTAPDNAVGVTVWFYANTNYEGISYWDDVTIGVVSSEN